MNRIPFDAFNHILLFLDQRSLANLSATDKKRFDSIQSIHKWPFSSLKPQLATSKEKILACFQSFLERLTINQPSHFLLSSSAGESIEFHVEVFCSNGSSVLGTKIAIPNWQIPNEPGSRDSATSKHLNAFTSSYQLLQQPQLSMAWGKFYRISLIGPSHFTGIDPTHENHFIASLEQALEGRTNQLQANEERKLIQHFQSLSPENQARYIAKIHRNLPTFNAMQQRMAEGQRLAEGQVRNRSHNSWSQNAVRVATIVAVIGAGIHFLIPEEWLNQYF